MHDQSGRVLWLLENRRGNGTTCVYQKAPTLDNESVTKLANRMGVGRRAMTILSVAEIIGWWTAAAILPVAGLLSALVIFLLALWAVRDVH